MSACRYCGLEMGAQRLPNHEARCPRNPDMFARLREFMVGYAEDGVGLPATLYSDLILGEHLPSVSQLNLVFGTWRAFVEACGLEHRPYHAVTGPKPELMPGSVMADDEDIWPTSVLRCVPVRIPVREWCPREKRYVDVAIQEAWRVR